LLHFRCRHFRLFADAFDAIISLPLIAIFIFATLMMRRDAFRH